MWGEGNRMKQKENKTKIFYAFLREHRAILVVLFLLLAERLILLYLFGPEYSLKSDDASYVASGIAFRHTGMITMHGVLSAQIMPGMPVFIGLYSFLFGEGTALWLALKITWIFLGAGAAWYVYRSVRIFAPKWCGVVAAAFLLTPEFAWTDNLVLTETPFLFLFSMMIYETLMMGKTEQSKYFWRCLAAFFGAFMLKANIIVYPAFAAVYLLVKKYDFRLLLRQGLLLCATVLCFIIPWTIRNYAHYDAFIPLTYGAGNPDLLGTYQGYGYPSDDSLDYKTNVDQVVQEKYQKYYIGGTPSEYIQKYLRLESDGIKAKYRKSVWWRTDPSSMVISYLVIKPYNMVFSVCSWDKMLAWANPLSQDSRYLSFAIILFGLIASLIHKRRRAEFGFLGITYLGQIYIYAMMFSFDRYAHTLLPLQYMMVGIGLAEIVRLFRPKSVELLGSGGSFSDSGGVLLGGERSVGVKALAVVSMLLLLVSHYLESSGLLDSLTRGTAEYYACWGLEALCYVSVGCFVMAVGFFFCRRNFRPAMFLRLWGVTLFWSFSLMLVSSLSTSIDLTRTRLFQSLLPFTNNRYWLATSLLILTLFLPLLNAAVRAMTRRQHLLCLTALTAVFVVLSNLAFYCDFAVLKTGANYPFFLLLYLTGAYFQKYPVTHPQKFWVIGYFGASLATVLSRPVLYRLAPGHVELFYRYNSIPVFFAAVCLFGFFHGAKMRNVRLADFFVKAAPLTIAVYLILGNPELNLLFWRKFQLVTAHFDLRDPSVLGLITVSAGIAVACCLELIRRKVSGFLHVGSAIERASARMMEKGRAWADRIIHAEKPE